MGANRKPLIAKKGTALVTGAAKRLGKAIALNLAFKGYNIALHYHQSKAEAIKTAHEIHKAGVHCELFPCDLSDENSIKQLLPKVFKAFPDLNLLVNSASIFTPSALGDLGSFSRHWAVNFNAPYILSCLFAEVCKKGQIINLIDTNAVKYKTKYAGYLLAKKSLEEFTKMAAVAWGPRIRVNGVSPGMILPPVNNQPDDRSQRAHKIPLQRVGAPKHIAQTIGFLLENDYVTGQVIAVDGGEQLV